VGARTLSEEGRDHGDHEGLLSGDQSEEDHQAFWNPEQGEGDPLSLICSGIASQPLLP
jgi:hypothetical protein